MEALMKKQKFSFRGSQVVINRGSGKEMVKSSQINRGTVVQLAAVVNQPVGGRSGTFEQRRQAGQYYKCGDQYVPGHQCWKQLLMLEGYEEMVEIEELPEEEEIAMEEVGDGEISLHALRGLVNSKTIKVEGKVKNHRLMVLIDSESTHNFWTK